MNLSSLSSFLSVPLRPHPVLSLKLRNTDGHPTFYCSKTQLWWAIIWSRGQMKSTILTQRTVRELAKGSLTRWNGSARSTRLAAPPGTTESNFRKPIKFSTRRVRCATSLKSWIPLRRASPTCGWTVRSMYSHRKCSTPVASCSNSSASFKASLETYTRE